MDIGTLTNEQKEDIWQSMKSQEDLIDGFPYIELGSKEDFFGEKDPTRGISLLSRLYYTFFSKSSN